VANQSSPQILSLLLGKLEVLDYIYLSFDNCILLVLQLSENFVEFLVNFVEEIHLLVANLKIAVRKIGDSARDSDRVLSQEMVAFPHKLDVKIAKKIPHFLNFLCLLRIS